MNPEIVILPGRGCRRSKTILDYLDREGFTYQRVDLDSPEGQRLAEDFHFLASPGILVNRETINPYDVLVRGACRVDVPRAEIVFAGVAKRHDH